MVTDTAATQVFRALADPTRREILAILREGEHGVGDIAGQFAMSRPAVSKHLRLLLEAHLVAERRDGRNRLYRLTPRPLREVDDWLADYRALWRGRLGELKRYLENPRRRH